LKENVVTALRRRGPSHDATQKELKASSKVHVNPQTSHDATQKELKADQVLQVIWSVSIRMQLRKN